MQYIRKVSKNLLNRNPFLTKKKKIAKPVILEKPENCYITEPKKCDFFGRPDVPSNICTFKFYVPPNETPLHKKFRESKENTMNWNIKYWREHNVDFKKRKEEFTQKLMQTKSTGVITAEDMGPFYKEFLELHYLKHKQYNKEWYKRNVQNIYLGIMVNIQKIAKSITPA